MFRSVRMFSSMPQITKGVHFDTIAREWRFKWSAEADKASLQSAQSKLNDILSKVKAVKGVKRVQRVVCGGCQDFKVVVSLPIADFKAWEAAQFAPEKQFLDSVKAVTGVTHVETQTYTLMDL